MPPSANEIAPENALERTRLRLRQEDYDRFLVSQYVPARHRGAVTALYALNAEIAKTRYVVSEPALGAVRLAWWREAVEEMAAGTVRNHDILQLLLEQNLPIEVMTSMIEARQADIEAQPMATLEELIRYAVSTGGQLEGLAAFVCGAGEEVQAAARKVGAAWALAGMMRSLPHNLSGPVEQRWNVLPQDLQAELGLRNPLSEKPEQVEARCHIVDRVCDVASHLLDDAGKGLAPSAKLLAVLTRSYLKALCQVGYDPVLLNEERGALGRLLRLSWGRLIG